MNIIDALREVSVTKLSIADSGFLFVESEQSPMHVGGLMIFELPPRARSGFCARLHARLRQSRSAAPPFDRRVRMNSFSLPSWVRTDDFDIDQHLFLHELPAPGTRTELYRLVAELHEPLLDRSRPLWAFHIIGGMTKRRFAVYAKLHHAYADGVTMTSWIAQSMARSPQIKSIKPLWTHSHDDGKDRASGEFHLAEAAWSLFRSRSESARTLRGIARIFSQLSLEKMGLTRNAISIPFSAPANTPLTGPLTSDRQLATAVVAMERVNRIRKAARASLNHVALSCIDEALHRYLEDLGHGSCGPIKIGMPVSLRRGIRTGADVGNEVAMVLVELAERTDDPYERLRDIGLKLRYVRMQVDETPPGAMMSYSMFMAAAAQLLEALQLTEQIPPFSNTVVSNVPGPRETLYLQGARLTEHYPVSTIAPGNQLNITLYSYDKNLHFGLVATRRLGNLPALGNYIYEAFVNLEAAVLDPLNSTSQVKSREASRS